MLRAKQGSIHYEEEMDLEERKRKKKKKKKRDVMLSNFENNPPLLVRLFVQFFVNMSGSWKGSFSFIGSSARKRKGKKEKEKEKAQPQEPGKKLREGLIDRSSQPQGAWIRIRAVPQIEAELGWGGM